MDKKAFPLKSKRGIILLIIFFNLLERFVHVLGFANEWMFSYLLRAVALSHALFFSVL